MPTDPGSLVVEIPISPPSVTAGSLWRDAVLDLMGSLCLSMAILLVSAIVVALVKGTDALSEMATSAWGIASILAATEIPLLWFGLRRRRKNREKLRPVMPWFRPNGFSRDGFGANAGGAIVRGVAGGFAIVVLSGLYSLAIQSLFGKDSIDNRLEFLEKILDDRVGSALLVLLIAGLAPVCEEILFRGAMFGPARAAGLNLVGVLISASLFSLVHFSLLLAPYYALVALLLCWLYARTETLIAPIVAHMTLNGIACAAVLFASNTSV